MEEGNLLEYKCWKEVRKLIDEGNKTRNREALKKYCLVNKELFPFNPATFQTYLFEKKFNDRQEQYIWEYLKTYHADKVKFYLDSVKLESA